MLGQDTSALSQGKMLWQRLGACGNRLSNGRLARLCWLGMQGVEDDRQPAAATILREVTVIYELRCLRRRADSPFRLPAERDPLLSLRMRGGNRRIMGLVLLNFVAGIGAVSPLPLSPTIGRCGR